ncbi:MAG TPA: hypothetical protein DCZ94_22855 [Lentisphaeria bacterium]|nr:MAG: hypothetical protein A2X48_14100 [Lentisphaerae bacterium GWF2_49_21]HBC89789.1 hypothetical protein [Lentisphaeria bacterium]
MKKSFISVQDAKFANWKEWFFKFGIELMIFSAIFFLAIFADRPSDIPGDRFMKCYFKEWTGGLPCPSCGLTRGFISFFHANFAEAFRLNALTYILIPFFAYRFIRSLSAAIFRKYLEIYLPFEAVMGIILLGLIYAFGRLVLEIGVKYHWF